MQPAKRVSQFERHISRIVRARSTMCAVWAVGPDEPVPLRLGSNRGVRPVRFGISADPDEIVRQAAHWHWVAVRLRAAVWCRSRLDAQAVVDKVESLMADRDRLSAAWADVTDRQIETLIRTAATLADVEIFDEAAREERLRVAIEREMRKLRQR